MLAERADEVFRQLFAHILIAADLAAPYRFSVRCFAGSLRLRLDVFLIVAVCGGRRVAQDLHIRHGSDEEHMAPQVDSLLHLCGNPCVGPFRNDQGAVVRALYGIEAGKLVRVPSGLESAGTATAIY